MSFPNAKHDDQVDTTVFALAWSTPSGGALGWLQYYGKQVEELNGKQVAENRMIRVRLPPPSTTFHLIIGRFINSVPDDVNDVPGGSDFGGDPACNMPS